MNALTGSRSPRSETGAALVEMAVALPVLVAILFGTVDFARVMYVGIEVTNAARAGAQYGAHDLGNSNDPAGMEATALNAAPNVLGMTVPDKTQTCQCAQNDGAGTPWASVSCTIPGATACSAGFHRIVSVTVTTEARFRTVGRYPGIPNDLLIRRTATMRVTE